jgi:hypothetical protein
MVELHMSLKQQLQEHLKEALRARDERRKSVIRMAMAAIVNAEVEHGGELDDADVVAILRKDARQRQDPSLNYGRLAGLTSSLKRKRSWQFLRSICQSSFPVRRLRKRRVRLSQRSERPVWDRWAP